MAGPRRFAVISQPFSRRSIPGVRKHMGNIPAFALCRNQGGEAKSENRKLPQIRFEGVMRSAPFSPALLSRRQTIPGVSKPPTSWVLWDGVKGENERSQSAKSAKGDRFGGASPSYWRSFGLRLASRRPAVLVFLLFMVLLGAAKFRGGPLFPLALLIDPVSRPQPIPGVS